MGIVAEREISCQFHAHPEEYFEHYVESSTALAQAMANAVRQNDFKCEGDYRYGLTEFAGSRWVPIGDAAGFVDPFFSSGVSIAQYSAKCASDEIVCAFQTGDFSRAAFLTYEQKVRAGVGIWYEFVRLYCMLLPLFTHFICSKQHRMEVLRLLQGEVYDRIDVPVLTAIQKSIDTVEMSDSYLLRGQLASISIDDLPLPW